MSDDSRRERAKRMERVADIASMLTPDQWMIISCEQWGRLDYLERDIREGEDLTPRMKGDMYFRGAAARVFGRIAAELEYIN